MDSVTDLTRRVHSRKAKPLLHLSIYPNTPMIVCQPNYEFNDQDILNIDNFTTLMLAQPGITSFTIPEAPKLSNGESVLLYDQEYLSINTINNMCKEMISNPVNLNKETRALTYAIFHSAVFKRGKETSDADSVSFGSLLQKCSSVMISFTNSTEISITLEYKIPLSLHFVTSESSLRSVSNLKDSRGKIQSIYLCDFQYQSGSSNIIREICFMSLKSKKKFYLYQHIYANVYISVGTNETLTLETIIAMFSKRILLNIGNFDRSETPFPNIINLQSAIGECFTYLSHLFRGKLAPCKLCVRSDENLDAGIIGTTKANSICAYRDCALVNTASMLIAINNLIYTKQLELSGIGSLPICIFCNRPLGVITVLYPDHEEKASMHPCAICDQITRVPKTLDIQKL